MAFLVEDEEEDQQAPAWDFGGLAKPKAAPVTTPAPGAAASDWDFGGLQQPVARAPMTRKDDPLAVSAAAMHADPQAFDATMRAGANRQPGAGRQLLDLANRPARAPIPVMPRRSYGSMADEFHASAMPAQSAAAIPPRRQSAPMMPAPGQPMLAATGPSMDELIDARSTGKPVPTAPPNPLDSVGPAATVARTGYHPQVERVAPAPEPESLVVRAGRAAFEATPMLPALRNVASVVGGATAAYRAAPTAAGEQLGGALPGHEDEPDSFLGRLKAHADLILSGRSGEVAPLGLVKAATNPADSVVHTSDVEQMAMGTLGSDVIPTDRVRGKGELLAMETARRGMDIVAQMLTDPVAIAPIGIHGIVGDLMAAAFAEQGIETAAQVAQDPNAKPEDVAEALLGVAMQTVPAAARAIVPKWREAVSSAALKAREMADAAEARRAAARTITPDQTDIAVTPERARLSQEVTIGPAETAPAPTPRPPQEPLTQAPPVIRPGASEPVGPVAPSPDLPPVEAAVVPATPRVEAEGWDFTGLPESLGKDAYAGPERRSGTRVAAPDEDLRYREMRAKVAAGERTGTPAARAAFDERQRVQDARAQAAVEEMRADEPRKPAEPEWDTTGLTDADGKPVEATQAVLEHPDEPPPERRVSSVRKLSEGYDNLNPHERRELGVMLKEMENQPFQKHTFNPIEKGAGGAVEIVPGNAGARVYNDIPGSGSRQDVIAAIQRVLDGKKPNAQGRGAIQAARARLSGSRDVKERQFDADAGDEPGRTYVETTHDMTPEEAVHEQAFREAVENKTDRLVKEYRKRHGNVVDADKFKELYKPYAESDASRAALNRVIHRSSSAGKMAVYRQMLSEPPKPGQNPSVTFVAGGPGAGKSTVTDIPAVKDILASEQVVVDGPLSNVKVANGMIRAAVEAGKQITIMYVHRDPVEAWTHGVQSRVGRRPPLDYHIDSHVKSIEAIRTLHRQWGDHPDVHFEFLENANGAPVKETSLERMPEAYNEGDVRSGIEARQSAAAEGAGAGGAIETPSEGGSGRPDGNLTESRRAEPAEEVAPSLAAAPATPVSAPPHDFSSTQVDLPPAVSSKIQKLAASIPDADLGEDGREDKPHVTVKYGLHTDDVADVRRVLAGEKPITVTLGKTSLFPAKEGADYDVVKVDVDSPDLHRLNAKIAGALEHTDTHPDYKPHATIAYVKAGLGKKYEGRTDLEGKTVTLNSITFSGKNRDVVSIPLSGNAPIPVMSKANASRGDNEAVGASWTPTSESTGIKAARRYASEKGQPYYVSRTGDVEAVSVEKPAGVWLRVEPDGRVYGVSGALLADSTTADRLDTGEEQPRLPGAEGARQVGKADVTFKAPQQASGEDFNLGAEETPEAKARREESERGPSLFDAPEKPAGGKGGGGVLSNAGPYRGLPPSPKPAIPVTDRMKPSAIIAKLQKGLGDIPVNVGRFQQRALGIYKRQPQAVRLKVANDLQTLAHEIGHHIDHAILGISYKDARWRDELQAVGQATSRPSYSVKQQRQEGAAEFLRLYLIEPAAAKADAPVYFAEFERRLNEHPELKKLLLEARGDLAGLIAQDPATRGTLRIDFSGTDSPGIYQRLKDDPKGEVRNLATLWSDDLHALRVAVDEMADARPIDARQNAYILARNARGTGGMSEGFLSHGVRGRNGRFISGSFADAITPVKDDLQTFASYLTARRVLEVQKLKGKETGMSADEATAIIAKVEAGPHAADMSRAADNVYAYQQGLLQYAREYHALSQEQFDVLLKEGHYVPLQRVMDAVGGAFGSGARKMANRSSPIKRMKGSGRDIVNPLESIIRNTFAIVDMVEKNRAMQALVRQADASAGSAKWLEKVPAPQVATKFNLSQVEQDVRAELDAAGVELPDNFDLDAMVKVFTPAQVAMPGQNLVTVIRDGVRQFYEVHDQALYDAITAVGGRAASKWIEWASKPATLLRAGATLTPGFIARNPTRDTLVAFMQSRYGFIPVYDTIRGFVSLALGDENAKLFMTSGIQQSSLVGADRDRLRKKINAMTQTGRVAFFKNVVLNPVDLLRAVSETMETATRLGEFRLARNAGGQERRAGILGVVQRVTTKNTPKSDDETLTRATLAARDVTTDFSRAGSVSREMNRVYAFFNARIQGYLRMAETAQRDPVGTGLNVALLALLSYALWWAHEDEDEYDELPDWEKNAYWHIPTGKGYVKVAKPFEWAYMANLTEAALNHVKKQDPSSLNRIRPDEDPKALAFALIPSALTPVLEASFNYDTFRDSPIVKPWDVGLQPDLQKSDWTTDTAITVSKLLAKGSGRRINVSPAKIDHVIFGYGAGFARGVVEHGSDPALRGLGITPRKADPAKKWQRVPVAGTFYREGSFDGGSQSLKEFYQAYQQTLDNERSLKRYAMTDKPAGRTFLADSVGEKWRQQGPALKAAKKQLEDLGDEINAVYAEPLSKATPEQKRQALDRIYEQMVNCARVALGKRPLHTRGSLR